MDEDPPQDKGTLSSSSSGSSSILLSSGSSSGHHAKFALAANRPPKELSPSLSQAQFTSKRRASLKLTRSSSQNAISKNFNRNKRNSMSALDLKVEYVVVAPF